MTTMRLFSRAAVGLAATTVAALAPVTVAAAGQSTYQYNFQNQHESDTFQDHGLCSEGLATINLTDYNEALHVTATQAGLTEDDIEALLEADNTDVITKLTYTQTGSFQVEEPTGVIYTGHFTSWFGGRVNPRTTVFSGTFNVNGVGSDGSRVSGHFVGHVTFVNGEAVVEFDKGDINGCLSA